MSQRIPRWAAGSESAQHVISLAVAVVLSSIVLNVLLVGRVSLFFDLCFITLCLAMAKLVKTEDLLRLSIAPPIMLLGVFALLAIVNPEVIADARDGFVQAVVTGVAVHSLALVSGYGLFLGVLAYRLNSGAESERPAGPDFNPRSDSDHQLRP